LEKLVGPGADAPGDPTALAGLGNTFASYVPRKAGVAEVAGKKKLAATTAPSSHSAH